jgi:hypothetical protein
LLLPVKVLLPLKFLLPTLFVGPSLGLLELLLTVVAELGWGRGQHQGPTQDCQYTNPHSLRGAGHGMHLFSVEVSRSKTDLGLAFRGGGLAMAFATPG